MTIPALAGLPSFQRLHFFHISLIAVLFITSFYECEKDKA